MWYFQSKSDCIFNFSLFKYFFCIFNGKNKLTYLLTYSKITGGIDTVLIVNSYYVTESFPDLGIVHANLCDYANYADQKLKKKKYRCHTIQKIKTQDC